MALPWFIRILRPVNAVMAGIASLLGVVVATGTIPPQSLLLVPVVVLITGAGNAVNDYYDREIDAVNRPDRPIPHGEVTPAGALRYSAVLFVAAVLLAIFVTPECLAIAVINSLVLVVYARNLKGLPLAGNLAVGYLAGSIFLFGGAFAGLEGLLLNIPVAGVTFLCMTSREVLKDAEDIEGDRLGGARTLPMITGVGNAARLSFLLALAAVILSYLPIFPWWGMAYVGLITVADIIILFGAAAALRCAEPACLRSSNATGILKNGMFLALGILIASAVLL
jgi:geranylgeranylglycerol-phosphate geranylgeranyltransferase